MKIRGITPEDTHWITTLLTDRWGSPTIITRERAHHAEHLPGFIAEWEERQAGLITYHIEDQECEIVSLDSLVEGYGIATTLINAVKQEARKQGCYRLWLITTNDNTPALRYYQKRGFRLARLYPNAVTESRRLKPSIPQLGIDGIPIRDELELEIIVTTH